MSASSSRLQHALEDVEAAAAVGLDDLGMQLAALGEADRPAVAERHGPRLALRAVGLHRRLFLGP